MSSRPTRQPWPSALARRRTSHVAMPKPWCTRGAAMPAASSASSMACAVATRGGGVLLAGLDQHARERVREAAGLQRGDVFDLPQAGLDADAGGRQRGHHLDVAVLAEVDRGHGRRLPRADRGHPRAHVGHDPCAGRHATGTPGQAACTARTARLTVSVSRPSSSRGWMCSAWAPAATAAAPSAASWRGVSGSARCSLGARAPFRQALIRPRIPSRRGRSCAPA